MTDTPFRTPDEWRRAREAFVRVATEGWDERFSVEEMFSRLYPCPPEGALCKVMRVHSHESAIDPTGQPYIKAMLVITSDLSGDQGREFRVTDGDMVRLSHMTDAPEEPPVNVPVGEFVNERYWCGCVRESRWVPRCERHKDNEHDEEPMTRGEEVQSPTPPDFDAAVDEFSNAVDVLVEYLMTDHPDTDRARSSRDAARTRLLALYREPVGEVYHVISATQWTNGIGGRGTDVVLGEHIALNPGQRVRVVKVAEGA